MNKTKKFIKAFFNSVPVILITITVFSAYGLWTDAKYPDQNVFEMSRNSGSTPLPDKLENKCVYYCLTRDNVLVWQIGEGYLTNGTYGTYFDDVDEKGAVRLEESEAVQLKDIMVKIPKQYHRVYPNDIDNSIPQNGFECTFSRKGKLYKLPESENSTYKDTPYYTLECRICEYIEKYHKLYKKFEDNKDQFVKQYYYIQHQH